MAFVSSGLQRDGWPRQANALILQAPSENPEDDAHRPRKLVLGTIMVPSAATVLIGWAEVGALRLAGL